MAIFVIAGTVNSVVDQLLAFREKTGDFGTLVYACHDWMDPVLAKRSMQLMADEVAACALTIRDQTIPPTANYEFEDPKCDLDFVPKRARRAKVECALVNVRGIGGSASTLIVSRANGF